MERCAGKKIIKSDVAVSKNYVSEKEISELNRIVSMYLDYAENQASRNIPMSMKDWKVKLDSFLQFNEYDLLNNAGKVKAEVAKQFVQDEYDFFRILQDENYMSDFDKETKRITDTDK